jgi:hypothetical protein
LPQFLEGPAETGRRLKAPKPAHRIVTLFDAAMVLLDPVVQMRVAALLNILPQALANRAWVGGVTTSFDPLGWLPSDSPSL